MGARGCGWLREEGGGGAEEKGEEERQREREGGIGSTDVESARRAVVIFEADARRDRRDPDYRNDR